MCFFEQESERPLGITLEGGRRGRAPGAGVGPGGSAQHAVCMGQRISTSEADGLKRKKADGLG